MEEQPKLQIEQIQAPEIKEEIKQFGVNFEDSSFETERKLFEPNHKVDPDLSIPPGGDIFDRLQALSSKMIKVATEFQRCINEARETQARQIELIQNERDLAIETARHQLETDDPLVVSGYDSVRNEGAVKKVSIIQLLVSNNLDE